MSFNVLLLAYINTYWFESTTLCDAASLKGKAIKERKGEIQFSLSVSNGVVTDWPLTVVWDDGPGHGRGVNSPDHPEHAQPAQMFSSLLSGQHLGKVREDNWHRTANPAEETF